MADDEEPVSAAPMSKDQAEQAKRLAGAQNEDSIADTKKSLEVFFYWWYNIIQAVSNLRAEASSAAAAKSQRY